MIDINKYLNDAMFMSQCTCIHEKIAWGLNLAAILCLTFWHGVLVTWSFSTNIPLQLYGYYVISFALLSLLMYVCPLLHRIYCLLIIVFEQQRLLVELANPTTKYNNFKLNPFTVTVDLTLPNWSPVTNKEHKVINPHHWGKSQSLYRVNLIVVQVCPSPTFVYDIDYSKDVYILILDIDNSTLSYVYVWARLLPTYQHYYITTFSST